MNHIKGKITKNISRSYNLIQQENVITLNENIKDQIHQKEQKQFQTLFPQLKANHLNKIAFKKTNQLLRNIKYQGQRYSYQNAFDLINLKQYQQNLKKFQYFKNKFNRDNVHQINTSNQFKNIIKIQSNSLSKQKRNKKLYFSQFSNRQHTRRPLTNQKYVQTLQKCFKNKSYVNKISKTSLHINSNEIQNNLHNKRYLKSLDNKEEQSYLQYMMQKMGYNNKLSTSKRKIQQSTRTVRMIHNIQMISKRQNLKRSKASQKLQPWMLNTQQNPQFQY